MEWISIKDKEPKTLTEVLVIGMRQNELNPHKEGPYIGIVEWSSANYSECKDYCAYTINYTDITHWMPLPKIK